MMKVYMEIVRNENDVSCWCHGMVRLVGIVQQRHSGVNLLGNGIVLILYMMGVCIQLDDFTGK